MRAAPAVAFGISLAFFTARAEADDPTPGPVPPASTAAPIPATTPQPPGSAGAPQPPTAAPVPATTPQPPTTAPFAASSPRPIPIAPTVVDLGREPGDTGRLAFDHLLWLPRETVNFTFIATDAAAGIVDNQQIVPRVEQLVTPRPGEIVIFPTAFGETRNAFNVGARMIATSKYVTTSIRGGFGGVDDVVGEAKIRVVGRVARPFIFTLEGLAERRTDLEYYGLGQTPATDPRNHFLGAPDVGLYREGRTRVISGFGMRPRRNLELLASTSITRRTIDDDPSAPNKHGAALDRVFARDSLPGAFAPYTIVYTELALRLDTRPNRAKPTPGVLLEGYAGTGRGIVDNDARFVRLGGRVEGFIPVYRRSNIFEPKIVLDGLAPIRDVQFAELPGEPDFRGFDTHRDYVSLVASFDYRYAWARPLATRLFFDLSTVAPSVAALRPAHVRFATGLGLDITSASAEVGRMQIAVSPEGVLLLLSFGVVRGFGDRQHRD